MKNEPVEGKCGRCKQPRRLFRYKPKHDCVENIGTVDLIDAFTYIASIGDSGDHWCMSKIERYPQRLMVCTTCFQKEVVEEEHLIENVLEG